MDEPSRASIHVRRGVPEPADPPGRHELALGDARLWVAPDGTHAVLAVEIPERPGQHRNGGEADELHSRLAEELPGGADAHLPFQVR